MFKEIDNFQKLHNSKTRYEFKYVSHGRHTKELNTDIVEFLGIEEECVLH